MGKILDYTLSWIFEKMAKAYVHRTGTSLSDAKVPVVQEDGGKPYFNLSSIGSADLSKLSGANALDGTIAEAISGLRSNLTSLFGNGIPEIAFISDLNNLAEYPRGERRMAIQYFGSSSANTPFPDGFLVSFIWRNIEGGITNIIKQFALEEIGSTMKHRFIYYSSDWSEWTTLH